MKFSSAPCQGPAAAPGEATGTEDVPGLLVLSPEAMPDPGGVGLPNDLLGSACLRTVTHNEVPFCSLPGTSSGSRGSSWDGGRSWVARVEP